MDGGHATHDMSQKVCIKRSPFGTEIFLEPCRSFHQDLPVFSNFGAFLRFGSPLKLTFANRST